jgi:hypothetical protein
MLKKQKQWCKAGDLGEEKHGLQRNRIFKWLRDLNIWGNPSEDPSHQ